MDVQTVFKRHFSYPPAHVVRAPGGLALLGGDVEKHDGLVIAAAINRYLHIASAPRTDGKIELVSSAFPGRELFWMSDLKKNLAASWADYVKGVLARLRKRGVNFSGFNAAIHSDIPMGFGLGSSAALQVATALTIRSLYPFSLTDTGATLPPRRNATGQLPPVPLSEKIHFARLCQTAESEFIGNQAGLLDKISSLFGKAWHVMSVDFKFITVEHSPIIGEVLVICIPPAREPKPDPLLSIKPPGVSFDRQGAASTDGLQADEPQNRLDIPNTERAQALQNDATPEVNADCATAAMKLRAKSLRSVELSYLKANKSALNDREYECAHYVVSEIARVAGAERALRDDDHRQFGQYLFQSYEGTRKLSKSSPLREDLLIELARKHPGCLGARTTGNRGSGATLNLVSHHQAQDFMAYIAREYEGQTGEKLQPMPCLIADGAA